MQPVLSGRDIAAQMRLGDEALAAGLWETAAVHFGDCMVDPALKPEEKPRVAICLIESWVREGRMQEALTLLGESFVSSHPQAPFWKGQALAGMGRIGDALDAAVVVYANVGPPLDTREITGKMFSPAMHVSGSGYGKVKMETGDGDRIQLIVPDPQPKIGE